MPLAYAVQAKIQATIALVQVKILLAIVVVFMLVVPSPILLIKH